MTRRRSVDALMKASYNGGAWTGGKFQSTTAPGAGLTLGWMDDGVGTVTVKDRGGWRPRSDGVVDFGDYGIVLGNYGATDATWAVGRRQL